MASSVPYHVNPIQWHQALAVSRQMCADVFRDGGTPTDAISSVCDNDIDDEVTWQRAVDLIAAEICTHPMPRAA